MIASHSCCRFVGCTSMMWISRSTTSQRCSIGLRSGDCGGHLSKVNSLSCSRNQSEMIWALWHGALSCWKYIRRLVHCSHKGMDMVSNNTQAVAFKRCSIGTKGPKVCQENIPPPPLHHHHQPEPLRQGRMIHAFMFFTPNSDSTIWTLKQKLRLSRPGNVFPIFYSLILVILCELYPPFPDISWQERHPV